MQGDSFGTAWRGSNPNDHCSGSLAPAPFKLCQCSNSGQAKHDKAYGKPRFQNPTVWHLVPCCWPLIRSEEHTSELQSRPHLVCRLLLEKKKDTVDGRA